MLFQKAQTTSYKFCCQPKKGNLKPKVAFNIFGDITLVPRTIVQPQEFLSNKVKTTHDLLAFCTVLHFKHNDILAHFNWTKDAVITKA